MSGRRLHGFDRRGARLLPVLHARGDAHLIANTLSLVAALIRRHPEAAEDLLSLVVAFVRARSFTTLSPPLVPLEVELRLAMMFVGIERARMGSRLRVQVQSAPGSSRALVPSGILQPLVENAICHGIAGRVAGGQVRILSRVSGPVLHLAVIDDGLGLLRSPPLKQTPRGVGVNGSGLPDVRRGWGLIGIRWRLNELFGDAARLRMLAIPGRGTLAAISLPAAFPRAGAQPSQGL